MNLQDYINKSIAFNRAKTMSQSDQLTLGKLIEKIEPIAGKQSERKDEATVKFDFEYLFPTTIDSWRGSYNELALNFVMVDGKEKELTVTDFLKLLKGAIGKEFTGYKGG
jgi:hypothetical protein